MTTPTVAVVGAGLAGLRACETLRQRGFTDPIVLIGAEPGMPYDRPPLSKHVLGAQWEPDRIVLRRPDQFAALELDHRPGVGACALDVEARTLTLTTGDDLRFDGLVIATGSVTRRLPHQPEVDGVCELRTLGDALAVRDRLSAGHRLVVIGAGFIGLEVAATAITRGCHVTVLEGLAAPLIRALGADMGAAVAAVHTRNGVDLRCSVTVAAIEHDGRAVTGVRLDDGSVVPADTVVVGIGVRPATDWLDDSGLTVRDGVVCDATLRSAPGVYAAGDCARWPNPVYGEEMRVEHWTNAAEQGAAAAANLLSEWRSEAPQPFGSVPFFWSDQFDSRIQFVGHAGADEEVQVVAGDPSAGTFAALYGNGGRLRGVLGVNMPRLVMPFRTLIADGIGWDEAVARVDALP